MAERDEINWQCPDFESPDATKLGFLKRCISQGIAWQQENCNTTDMQRAQLARTMYMTAILEAGADLLNENADGPQPESDFIRCRR